MFFFFLNLFQHYFDGTVEWNKLGSELCSQLSCLRCQQSIVESGVLLSFLLHPHVKSFVHFLVLECFLSFTRARLRLFFTSLD